MMKYVWCWRCAEWQRSFVEEKRKEVIRDYRCCPECLNAGAGWLRNMKRTETPVSPSPSPTRDRSRSPVPVDVGSGDKILVLFPAQFPPVAHFRYAAGADIRIWLPADADFVQEIPLPHIKQRTEVSAARSSSSGVCFCYGWRPVPDQTPVHRPLPLHDDEGLPTKQNTTLGMKFYVLLCGAN